MARLQILELPSGISDDRPPFVLVIDQVDDAFRDELGDPNYPLRGPQADLAQTLGARAVLVFRETVQIPANDTTASPEASKQLMVSADLRGLRSADVAADVAAALRRQGRYRWNGPAADAVDGG